MQRIFAELDDQENNVWGFDCPRCRQYQDYENPSQKAQEMSCSDCHHSFIVSFA